MANDAAANGMNLSQHGCSRASDSARAGWNYEEKNIVTDAEIDAAMPTWMENEFMKGNPASSGERLLSAWMDKYPSFGRHAARKMPKTWRSLQGWQRLSPCRSRKPWVRAVWSGIACRLVEQGQHSISMGLLVMSGLLSYARPGTVRPGASTSRDLAEFLSHPGSRRNSQTNEGTNGQRYTRAGRSLGSKTRPLLEGPQRPKVEKTVVALDLSDFLPIFLKAITDLTLPPIVPYQWRHFWPVDRCSRRLPDVGASQKNEDDGKS